MQRAVFVLFAVAFLLTGCGGFRFVIDAVPAEEDLIETTVLDGPSRGLWRKNKVALIDVSGAIINARLPGLLADRESPVGRFAEALRKAAADAAVKAVIVRINSPGGTVTASEVAYRELRHFRNQTGKPAVILMDDMAASGGYYLACAGDRIIAHPTTVTGSIGVVMQTFDLSEGMNRIGIKSNAIVSGSNKAVGSPFEPMTAEHRAVLQAIVDEFYDGFVDIVKEARPELNDDDLEWITDGRVVTGARAAEIGLVDEVGDLRDAFAAAKALAKIPGARLVKYHRPLEHVGSAYAQTPSATSGQVNLLQLNIDAGPLNDHTGFYYLWDPTVW